MLEFMFILHHHNDDQMYVCVCVHVCVYVCVYACTCVRMCMYVLVCMCVCMYECMTYITFQCVICTSVVLVFKYCFSYDFSYSSEFENLVDFLIVLVTTRKRCFSSGSKLEKSFDSDSVPVINFLNVIHFDFVPGF